MDTDDRAAELDGADDLLHFDDLISDIEGDDRVGIEPSTKRPDRSKAKRRTQDEVDLFDSLQSLEDDDLAIHLYNVHGLKRRLCDASDGAFSRVKPYQRKQRWVRESQKNEWTPRMAWTSWPLEPDRLPRIDERFYGDHGIDTSIPKETKPLKKPSGHLEEALLSEMLRQVRTQHRKVADPTSNTDVGYPAPLQRATHSINNLSSTLAEPTGSEHFQISTDEADAERVARPVIRSLISKLEDLLGALHQSRRAHLGVTVSKTASARGKKLDYSSSGTSRSPSRHSKPSAIAPRDWSEVLGLAAISGWDAEIVKRASERCSGLFDEKLDVATFEEGQPRPQNWVSGGDIEHVQAAGLPKLDFRTLNCPVPTCPRHREPYQQRWRLSEHLRRQHGYSVRLKDFKPTPTEDRLHGGVHVDGYLEPIKAPTHWRSPRTYVRNNVSDVERRSIRKRRGTVNDGFEDSGGDDDSVSSRSPTRRSARVRSRSSRLRSDASQISKEITTTIRSNSVESPKRINDQVHDDYIKDDNGSEDETKNSDNKTRSDEEEDESSLDVEDTSDG